MTFQGLKKLAFIIFSVQLILSAAHSSQGLTKADSILRDHLQSKNLAEFLQRLTKYSIPGDYEYLNQLIASNPDWKKANSLMKLHYDKGVFTLKKPTIARIDTAAGVTLELPVKPAKAYRINGHQVEFLASDLPPQRLQKIRKALNARKAAYWLLVPSADAIVGVSAQEAMMFSLLSIYDQDEFSRFDRGLLGEDTELGECRQPIEELMRAIVGHSVPIKSLKCAGEVLQIEMYKMNEQNAVIGVKSNQEFSVTLTESVSVSVVRSFKADAKGKFSQVAGQDSKTDLFVARFSPVSLDSKINGFCATECSKPMNVFWAKIEGSKKSPAVKTPEGKQ